MRRTDIRRFRGVLCILVLLGTGVVLATTGGTASAAPDPAPVWELRDLIADSPHSVPLGATRSPHGAGARAAVAPVVTASATFGDAVDDVPTDFVLDLRRMAVSTRDDGRLTVAVTADSNTLYDGDFLAAYIDVDGDAGTGDDVVGGADLSVGLLGDEAGDDLVGAAMWDGTEWQPVDLPSLEAHRAGTTDLVWSVAASEIDVRTGTRTGLLFVSINEGFEDYAPEVEPEAPPFRFTAGALVPGLAGATGPGVRAGGAASPGQGARAGARAVGVRRFAVRSSAGGLRMRLSWVRGDGRVRWTLRLRGAAGGRTLTRVVTGSGAAGARTVLRRVRLSPAWDGARIAVRLRVTDASGAATRTRIVSGTAARRA